MEEPLTTRGAPEMTLKFLSAAIVTTVLLMPAPAPAIDFNPFSAIKGAVEAAVEDRKAEDIANDTRIKAEITAEVIDAMGTDVISISANVYEGDVMLTGAVEKAGLKLQAEALTKKVEGVRKVYNEILVIKPLDQKKGAAEAFVDDTVIEGKINALLLDATGVNVTNFRVVSRIFRTFLQATAPVVDVRSA